MGGESPGIFKGTILSFVQKNVKNMMDVIGLIRVSILLSVHQLSRRNM
jgi:hypothetical protein